MFANFRHQSVHKAPGATLIHEASPTDQYHTLIIVQQHDQGTSII